MDISEKARPYQKMLLKTMFICRNKPKNTDRLSNRAQIEPSHEFLSKTQQFENTQYENYLNYSLTMILKT